MKATANLVQGLFFLLVGYFLVNGDTTASSVGPRRRLRGEGPHHGRLACPPQHQAEVPHQGDLPKPADACLWRLARTKRLGSGDALSEDLS